VLNAVLDRRVGRSFGDDGGEANPRVGGVERHTPAADAGLPMTNAENALVRYRPVLETRAQRAGVSWGPAKGLGAWQGGKYLQVSQFWLATDPARNQLIAACGKEDQDVVAHLAGKLGHPTGRHGSNLSVAILSEEDLRNPDHDLGAAVSAAFDFWFDTKASDLSTSEVSEPPASQSS